MKLKCGICGRDIGTDSPGMMCWTCYNKKVQNEPSNNLIKPNNSKIKVQNKPSNNLIKPNNSNITVQNKKADEENRIKELINKFTLDSSTRNRAVYSLVNIGEPSFRPVSKASRSSESVIRRKACDYFGLMGDPRGVMPLVRLLTDSDRYVRRRAANALILIGDERAVIPLTKALNDTEDKVRSRAAKALGNIGDSKAIESLKKASHDSRSAVREEALKSLLKIVSDDKY